MITFVSSIDDGLLNAAEHQAKTALRYGRQGNKTDFNRALDRMYDTILRCQYPRLSAMRLVNRIGRSKALVLKLDKPLIDLGLTMVMEAPRHVSAPVR